MEGGPQKFEKPFYVLGPLSRMAHTVEVHQLAHFLVCDKSESVVGKYEREGEITAKLQQYMDRRREKVAYLAISIQKVTDRFVDVFHRPDARVLITSIPGEGEPFRFS